MLSLTDYLNDIYKDFVDYINRSDEYCELLDLDFRGEHLPNYQNEGIVQLYLLRYAYAYLFEYKHIFTKFIPKRDPFKIQNLKVISVGCGNYLDYWGAALACDAVNKSCGIKYTGLDPVNWKYKVDPRQRDSIQFENKTFYEFLKTIVENDKGIDVNVIVFPKSIGEFSKDEIRGICVLLKRCKFNNKKILVIFSFRDCLSNKEIDMNRAAMIVDAFKNHRSIPFSVSNFDRTRCYGIESQGIRAVDNSFIYPNDIICYIQELANVCDKQNVLLEKCVGCSQALSRWPILKTDYINYSYALITLIKRKEN